MHPIDELITRMCVRRISVPESRNQIPEVERLTTFFSEIGNLYRHRKIPGNLKPESVIEDNDYAFISVPKVIDRQAMIAK